MLTQNTHVSCKHADPGCPEKKYIEIDFGDRKKSIYSYSDILYELYIELILEWIQLNIYTKYTKIKYFYYENVISLVI